MVCARHLSLFGYTVSLMYPKRPEKMLPLLHQAKITDVTDLDSLPTSEFIESNFDFIVDAIFGYSFSGAIRAPFDSIILQLAKSKIPVISLDVPSGWDVENGDLTNTGFIPTALSTTFLCISRRSTPDPILPTYHTVL